MPRSARSCWICSQVNLGVNLTDPRLPAPAMTKVPRLLTIFAVVVVALIAWSRRPPTRMSGSPPFFAPDLPSLTNARAVAESIFALRGTIMDSVYLRDRHTLVVVLPAGAHTKPVWFERDACVGGERAWRPAEQLAVDLYAQYAVYHDIARIEVRSPGVTAVDGGWGWRASCTHGAGTSGFDRRTLDSLRAKAS